jgi:uncharacterized protein YuzE
VKGEMKISYDKEADALYIRLLEGEYQCRVVQLTDDIALDFAAGEQLVGIEMLGASRLFEKPEAPTIELQDLLPKIVAA